MKIWLVTFNNDGEYHHEVFKTVGAAAAHIKNIAAAEFRNFAGLWDETFSAAMNEAIRGGDVDFIVENWLEFTNEEEFFLLEQKILRS